MCISTMFRVTPNLDICIQFVYQIRINCMNKMHQLGPINIKFISNKVSFELTDWS